MSYIKTSLSSKETLIKDFPLHPFLYSTAYFMFFIAIVSAVFVFQFQSDPLMIKYSYGYSSFLYVIPGLLILMSLWKFFTLKSIEYGLTDRRIISKPTVLSRNTDEILNKSVESVKLTQSLVGRIFRFGDVEITGRGNEIVTLYNVAKPLVVKKMIEEEVFDA